MKTSSREQALNRVVAEFMGQGILLESDPRLPSVVGLVTGKPMKGSWWGHPEGRAIWRILKEFCGRRDVLSTKLVSGKVTFVHRRLWPQVLALGTSQEGWQTRALSKDARILLHVVEKKGEVRTDAPGLTKGPIGPAARELERRILIQSDEIHTERGAHAKVLRSWKRWAKGVGFAAELPSVQDSKKELEEIVRWMNERHSASGRLPWNR